jgi:hypothetical protein
LEPRGAAAKLGELMRELKANQINVIVAAGFSVVLACKVANVPTVVAFGGGDPVATNLVDSLARRGGGITGISDNATALSTKRLALIKQAVPSLICYLSAAIAPRFSTRVARTFSHGQDPKPTLTACPIGPALSNRICAHA